MGYKDLYKKVVYINKDDPAFVPGSSPSISAEHLNAMQDGVIHSLEGIDKVSDSVNACHDDIETLFDRTAGVAYKQQFTDLSVPRSAWHKDSTYEYYPYMALIPIPIATKLMTPEVIFGLEDATSGVFAPISETTDGGVLIFAYEIPDDAVVIPTIILWR